MKGRTGQRSRAGVRMDGAQGLLPLQECPFLGSLRGMAPAAAAPSLYSSWEPGGPMHSATHHPAGMPTTPGHPNLPPGKGWQAAQALPASSRLPLTSSDADTVLLPRDLWLGDPRRLAGQHRTAVDHHHHHAGQGLQGGGLCEQQGSAAHQGSPKVGQGTGSRTPRSKTRGSCTYRVPRAGGVFGLCQQRSSPCRCSGRHVQAVPA